MIIDYLKIHFPPHPLPLPPGERVSIEQSVKIPSPSTGEGLPCGACLTTPQGKGEGETIQLSQYTLASGWNRVIFTGLYLTPGPLAVW
jgi:hypothetical protein